MKKKQAWLFAIPLLLAGCFTEKPLEQRDVIDLDGALWRAKEHSLAVRADDVLQRLGREYREQTLLLAIPGMIRAGATAEEARPALETAVGYVQILMTPGDRRAEEAVRARAGQLLELQTARLWLELTNCETELENMETARENGNLVIRYEDRSRQCRERIAETRLELRTLMGLAPGEDFESLAPSLPADLKPGRRAALLTAFANRPEFTGTLFGPEKRLVLLEKLESLLPPDTSSIAATRGLQRAEQLLRLPVKLAQRQLTDRAVPPEFREMALALGIAAQIDLDFSEIARLRAANQTASADWRRAQMRLRTDLGIPVNGEPEPAAGLSAPQPSPNELSMLYLLVDILSK